MLLTFPNWTNIDLPMVEDDWRGLYKFVSNRYGLRIVVESHSWTFSFLWNAIPTANGIAGMTFCHSQTRPHRCFRVNIPSYIFRPSTTWHGHSNQSN